MVPFLFRFFLCLLGELACLQQKFAHAEKEVPSR